MQSINQIIHAPWIMTCDEGKSILKDHALVIEKGLIKEITPSKTASKTYPDYASQQFDSHILLPGFINSHTHSAMNYFRGLGDDLSLMNWLNNYIWPAEKKWVSEEFVRDASQFAIAEMIRSGTTCFNDMYFFLQATAESVDLAGLRAAIGVTVIDLPTAWAKDADDYIAKGLEFIQEYKNHPRIIPTMAPHAPYTVEDKTLLKIADIAKLHNLKINLHLHETADEVKQSMEKIKLRPIQRLHNLGLLSPQLVAIHMTQLNEDDISILEKTKPHIVHCPESNMKLASGVCPVEKLKKCNLNIALGTDGAASNNDLDMMGEMRTAAFLAKLSSGDPTTLSAEEAIRMATINGAKALAIDTITGSLAPGKSADFIAINLNEIETLPLYNPASQLVYAASRNQVTDVWVSGKQLLKNRQLLTLNEQELKEKASYWRKKISAC